MSQVDRELLNFNIKKLKQIQAIWVGMTRYMPNKKNKNGEQYTLLINISIAVKASYINK